MEERGSGKSGFFGRSGVAEVLVAVAVIALLVVWKASSDRPARPAKQAPKAVVAAKHEPAKATTAKPEAKQKNVRHRHDTSYSGPFGR